MKRAARTTAICAFCTSITLAAAPAYGREPPDPDPWFSADKALHFGASAVIAGGGYGISAPFFHHSRLPPLLIGAGAGILAGVGKELYDATGAGDPSGKDLVWDGIGITTGLLIAVGIDLLVRGWSLDPKDPKDGKAAIPLATPSGGYVVRF